MVSLCSLMAGEKMFGIDTRQILEVLGSRVLQRVPLTQGYIGGIVPYRGEVLTTVSLRALLGLEASGKAGCVVVLESEGEERYGLLADGVGAW